MTVRLRNASITPEPESENTSSEHSPASTIFDQVPETPTKLNPDILREANTALKSTLAAGIVNTPVKSYIDRLTFLTEQLQATNTILQKNVEGQANVLKRRWEHSTGKRIALKEVMHMTMAKVLARAQIAENESSAHKRQKTVQVPDIPTTLVVQQSGSVTEYIEEN